MKIAVFGTGMVGETIGNKLIGLGHEVMMGSRSASNEKALAWATKAAKGSSVGTFADAAAFGEVGFNCTSGSGALAALTSAGQDPLRGKLVIDISNPLDFSKGFPPSLSVVNTDSLGEQLQRALPETHFVKTLNTVNCNLMVDPGQLAGGDHSMFMCGNDNGAKGRAREILTGWFGWKDVIDLGDISMARGTEMYLPLWVRLYGALQTPAFNIKVVK
jgi:predicted dinucleotide-binding enzyme